MMTPDEVEDAAARLFEAERTRKQIGLLSLDFPGATWTTPMPSRRPW